MNGQAPRRRSTLLPILLTVGSIAALLTTPLAGVAQARGTCRVRNHTTGVTYPGSTGPTLQTAIREATHRDVIVVRGRCVGSFSIRKGLTVIGKPRPGFPVAMLDGDRMARVLDVGYRRVYLRDLRITRGLVDVEGGGIRNSGSLVLNSVIVNDNKAKQWGGGIANQGTLTLKGETRINANRAGINGGGGIFNLYGTLSLRGSSRVSRNTSANVGGGIYNGGQVFMYRSSRVSQNGSGNGGGGIFGGLVTLYGHARISRNTAGLYIGSSAPGGGMLAGLLTLNGDSRINGNSARSGGGVCGDGYNLNLMLVMNDRSKIVGNTAVDGGGVCNYETTMIMNDSSRISRNVATRNGGGVWDLDGAITMTGSASISGNIAEGGTPSVPSGIGGGIRTCRTALTGVTTGGNVSANVPDDIAECP